VSSRVDAANATPRVMMLHNRYREPGGEDVALEQEAALLEDRGHAVRVLEWDNREIDTASTAARARLFARTIWSSASHRVVRDAIRDFRPDIVHVHNYLPLLSPSAYYAAWSEGVAVVQTLHNYRLVCPGGLLLRNGRVCEDCVGRSTLRGAVHACYRGSRLASAAVSAMIEVHRARATWRAVQGYIVLSEFQRAKLIEGGLPADRLHYKPNFVAWSSLVRSGPGEYALYAGRLSPEKGIRTLVEAWARAGREGVAGLLLKVVGGGPLIEELRTKVAATRARVELLGFRTRAEIAELLIRARFLVYPSELHEPNGFTLIEAFAAGVPIIASRMGSLSEFVDNERTGLHFEAGDADDLSTAALRLGYDLTSNIRMGHAARATYLAHYTPSQNYEQLMDVYRAAAGRMSG
jgi:glycosyltransferase involved in cell wall biosynthesis